VCVASSKGLFGNIQKPRSKVPSWRFLQTFNVETRQSKECQHDLYQDGEKVVAIVNHAGLSATATAVVVAIVALIVVAIVALVVVVGHGASNYRSLVETRGEWNIIDKDAENRKSSLATTPH
jgi:hypothetical protein